MLLEDIATFLAGNGFGIFNLTPNSIDSTIFVGAIPPAPSTMIALEEYPGIRDPRAWTLDGSVLPQWELPRFHLTVRGEPNDYLTPRTTAEKIYQLFLRTVDRPLFGATQYNRITPLGTIYPMPLNSDPNNCRLFTFNCEVMKGISILP
jgi:hypothetical protein